jgi:hypothetical protein
MKKIQLKIAYMACFAYCQVACNNKAETYHFEFNNFEQSIVKSMTPRIQNNTALKLCMRSSIQGEYARIILFEDAHINDTIILNRENCNFEKKKDWYNGELKFEILPMIDKKGKIAMDVTFD